MKHPDTLAKSDENNQMTYENNNNEIEPLRKWSGTPVDPALTRNLNSCFIRGNRTLFFVKSFNKENPGPCRIRRGHWILLQWIRRDLDPVWMLNLCECYPNEATHKPKVLKSRVQILGYNSCPYSIFLQWRGQKENDFNRSGCERIEYQNEPGNLHSVIKANNRVKGLGFGERI